jgi:hypothetical protein
MARNCLKLQILEQLCQRSRNLLILHPQRQNPINLHLWHNFWSDLDTNRLNTSKWPPGPYLFERFLCYCLYLDWFKSYAIKRVFVHFFDKFFDEFFNLLTIASFRIGVPSILFLHKMALKPNFPPNSRYF